MRTHEDFDDGRPLAEMACVAPPAYWRRRPRRLQRAISRVLLVAAFLGMAGGFLLLLPLQ